jgi:hypothetical protein
MGTTVCICPRRPQLYRMAAELSHALAIDRLARLLAGAAGPELDPGHDGDDHQQPGGEQDVQDEAEDG